MLGSRTESCGKNDRYVIEMARHLVREFDHNYEIVGLAAHVGVNRYYAELSESCKICAKVWCDGLWLPIAHVTPVAHHCRSFGHSASAQKKK